LHSAELLLEKAAGHKSSVAATGRARIGPAPCTPHRVVSCIVLFMAAPVGCPWRPRRVCGSFRPDGCDWSVAF